MSKSFLLLFETYISPKVTLWKVGDRVCGDRGNFGSSAMAELTLFKDESELARVPDSVPLRVRCSPTLPSSSHSPSRPSLVLDGRRCAARRPHIAAGNARGRRRPRQRCDCARRKRWHRVCFPLLFLMHIHPPIEYAFNMEHSTWNIQHKTFYKHLQLFNTSLNTFQHFFQHISKHFFQHISKHFSHHFSQHFFLCPLFSTPFRPAARLRCSLRWRSARRR